MNQLLKLLVFLYLLCQYMLNTVYGLWGHSPWWDLSVQFSSVTQSCSTLCDPMDCSIPGFPVHPGAYSNSYLSSQWCHPTISSSVIPSPTTFNLSQHQGLFQWVSSSYQVAKVLELQLQISPSCDYSGLISFRIALFDLLAVQGTLKSLFQHHSSRTSVLWCSAFFMVQFSHLYMTMGKTHKKK